MATDRYGFPIADAIAEPEVLAEEIWRALRIPVADLIPGLIEELETRTSTTTIKEVVAAGVSAMGKALMLMGG